MSATGRPHTVAHRLSGQFRAAPVGTTAALRSPEGLGERRSPAAECGAERSRCCGRTWCGGRLSPRGRCYRDYAAGCWRSTPTAPRGRKVRERWWLAHSYSMPRCYTPSLPNRSPYLPPDRPSRAQVNHRRGLRQVIARVPHRGRRSGNGGVPRFISWATRWQVLLLGLAGMVVS
jgi:hypothetical protein